jgi:hypothetical protein
MSGKYCSLPQGAYGSQGVAPGTSAFTHFGEKQLWLPTKK